MLNLWKVSLKYVGYMNSQNSIQERIIHKNRAVCYRSTIMPPSHSWKLYAPIISTIASQYFDSEGYTLSWSFP